MRQIKQGERFGKLEVIGLDRKEKYKTYYSCMCDCGALTIKREDHLLSEKSKSCGCLRAENSGENSVSFRHGMRKSREYNIWNLMRNRCLDPKNKRWESYGGRGISLCDRWLDFANFFADMGAAPSGHSIDRIDVNGNYEPGNCRWATSAMQSQNKRNNKLTMEKASEIRLLRSQGMSFKKLSELFGVSEGSIGFVLSNKQWRKA